MTTLAKMLTEEHEAIDAALAAFMAAEEGSGSLVPTLQEALATLRRHIYLEEEILFPPLRMGGLFAAIIVMLRDHGPMWRLMDQLEALLGDGCNDPQIPELCGELVALLAAHNNKEETTIYAQVDEGLPAEAARQLREFLDAGTLPAGWRCAKA